MQTFYQLFRALLFLPFVFILSIVPVCAQPHFDFEGTFNFLITQAPPNAFELTPDKRIGVVFTRVFRSQVLGGEVTSFDVATGKHLDSKFVGFGPLQVQLTQLNDGFRVVALTSHGGSDAVTIYDMDDAGILTFRAERLLNFSSSSNLVLSARGRAGFVTVAAAQLVSFSLDTGAILQRRSLPVLSSRLDLYEDSTHCTIVSGSVTQLFFFNANDPAQVTTMGEATLPATGFNNDIVSVFSMDGAMVFAGGGGNLSAIETATRQVLGSLNEPYETTNLKVIEVPDKRYLAQLGGNGSNFYGMNLIDASDPSKLTVVSQSDLRQDFAHRDFVFGSDARTLILSSDYGLLVYRVPQLIPVLKTSFDPTTSFGFNIKTIGDPERIIGAWGSNNSFSATIFTVPIKINRVVNFDLDASTDLGVFNPSKGTWRWLRSLDGTVSGPIFFGQPGGVPVPADYDGDSITDLAVFRNNQWQILESSTAKTRNVSLGLGSAIPVPADFDGDGKADVAVFRKDPNRWTVIQSSDGKFIVRRTALGKRLPVSGDYDADGKADFVTFAAGVWNIQSSSGVLQSVAFGQAGDIPVPGDYDNDGKSDLGVYRPGTRTWSIMRSYSGMLTQEFGGIGDIPVPADYDGDGRTDLAMYRPATATWDILLSPGGGRTVQFGGPGDRPLTQQF